MGISVSSEKFCLNWGSGYRFKLFTMSFGDVYLKIDISVDFKDFKFWSEFTRISCLLLFWLCFAFFFYSKW